MLRRLAVVVALIASGIAIASCGGESAAYENGYRVATAISNQGGGNFGTPNAAAECQLLIQIGEEPAWTLSDPGQWFSGCTAALANAHFNVDN